MEFSEAVEAIDATLDDSAQSLLTRVDLAEGQIRLYQEVDHTVNPPVMTIIYAMDPSTTELPVDQYGIIKQTLKGIRRDINVGYGAIVIDEALIYTAECSLTMDVIDAAMNEMLTHFENAHESVMKFKAMGSRHVDDDYHRHDDSDSHDYGSSSDSSDSGSSSSSD